MYLSDYIFTKYSDGDHTLCYEQFPGKKKIIIDNEWFESEFVKVIHYLDIEALHNPEYKLEYQVERINGFIELKELLRCEADLKKHIKEIFLET